jgi:hypothetical protein
MDRPILPRLFADQDEILGLTDCISIVRAVVGPVLLCCRSTVASIYRRFQIFD